MAPGRQQGKPGKKPTRRRGRHNNTTGRTKTTLEKPYLANMPPEVKLRILQQLSARQLPAVRVFCRELRDFVNYQKEARAKVIIKREIRPIETIAAIVYKFKDLATLSDMSASGPLIAA